MQPYATLALWLIRRQLLLLLTRIRFDVYSKRCRQSSVCVPMCLSLFSRKLTMLRIGSALIAICIFSGVYAANLETVHDDELLNLIKTEKYVVVLFSKSCIYLSFCSLSAHVRFSLIKTDKKLSSTSKPLKVKEILYFI